MKQLYVAGLALVFLSFGCSKESDSKSSSSSPPPSKVQTTLSEALTENKSLPSEKNPSKEAPIENPTSPEASKTTGIPAAYLGCATIKDGKAWFFDQLMKDQHQTDTFGAHLTSGAKIRIYPEKGLCFAPQEDGSYKIATIGYDGYYRIFETVPNGLKILDFWDPVKRTFNRGCVGENLQYWAYDYYKNGLLYYKNPCDNHNRQFQLAGIIGREMPTAPFKGTPTEGYSKPASPSVIRYISKKKLPDLKVDFVTLRAGQFIMGSGTLAAETQFVEFSRDIDMQTTPVTQLQWYYVMKTNPSFFSKRENCPDSFVEINETGMCPNNPVESVDFESAQSFAANLTSIDSQFSYRLPTEAEWEYAARAGTTTRYFFGDTPDLAGDYAWSKENSGDQTRPVAQKKPNPWGLYDMLGNVQQWVQDEYDRYLRQPDYYGVLRDPLNHSSSPGPSHVIRGEAYYGDAKYLASSSRTIGFGNPYPVKAVNPVTLQLFHGSGFRLVRAPK